MWMLLICSATSAKALLVEFKVWWAGSLSGKWRQSSSMFLMPFSHKAWGLWALKYVWQDTNKKQLKFLKKIRIMINLWIWQKSYLTLCSWITCSLLQVSDKSCISLSSSALQSSMITATRACSTSTFRRSRWDGTWPWRSWQRHQSNVHQRRLWELCGYTGCALRSPIKVMQHQMYTSREETQLVRVFKRVNPWPSRVCAACG